jgi:hypothetical protein
VIDAALRRFEKLKPAYASLSFANANLRKVAGKDSAYIQGQARLINWYKTAYSQEQALRQDSNAKQEAWKSKAKRRGFLNVLGLIGLGVLSYVVITK